MILNSVQEDINFLKTFLNYLKELVVGRKAAQNFDRNMVGFGWDVLGHNPTVVVHWFLDHVLSTVVVPTFRSFSMHTTDDIY